MNRGRRAVFTAITLAFPFLLLGLVEGGLRLAGYGDDASLFHSPPYLQGRWLTPRFDAARRFFPADGLSTPTPPRDVFLAAKPANGLRLFVLGESTTAGFPFPANGTFSRVLQDALTDVLPGVAVEVVNVGIPAISSYVLLEQVGPILEQRPDAVLIYTGHNEYYGALGAASSVRIGGSPGLVRLYLGLLHLRTVQLLRNNIARASAALADAPAGDPAASRMELMVRDANIALDGPLYRRGVTQFEENLARLVGRFRQAGVPVFVASLAGNLRSQRPFGSDTAGGPSAAAAFDSATALLAAGDTAGARARFERARDLDVIRFRAPGAFNPVIRRVAESAGATYVPVAEAFDAAAPGGIPGSELFYEHVHPTQHGYALIARAFFDAIAGQRFLGRTADPARLASWDAYEQRMALTDLDLTTARLVVAMLGARWPFVPPAQARDALANFRPATLADSLAAGIAGGSTPWAPAKARLGVALEAAGRRQEALREYEGLMRDEPWHELPHRLAGKLLLELDQLDRARTVLEHARELERNDFTSYALGVIAAKRGDLPTAMRMLEESLQLKPRNPAVLFQLSLVSALGGNPQRAREIALELAQAAPGYPGLADWLKALGLPSP